MSKKLQSTANRRKPIPSLIDLWEGWADTAAPNNSGGRRLLACYYEGHAAHLAGKTLGDNPHTQATLAEAWDKGYLVALLRNGVWDAPTRSEPAARREDWFDDLLDKVRKDNA